MPRKITVTQGEEYAVSWALAVAEVHKASDKTQKALASLLAKIRESKAAKTGLTLSEAEAALSGCRKYSKFVGGNAGMLVNLLAAKAATPDQLAKVGRWVDGQAWLTSVDLGLILTKWEGWLARAAALDAGSGGSSYFSGPAGFEE